MYTTVTPTSVETQAGQMRFSLFQLSVADGKVVTRGSRQLDLRGYSRFKYGDDHETKRLAKQLASALVERFGNTLNQLYLAASPYKHVPSAAYNLLVDTVYELSILGYNPRGICKIDRGIVKAVDYSTLTSEQRKQSNAGRKVNVPETARLQLSNNPLLIIDDIRVSGTTETETRKALSLEDIKTVHYGYISEVVNDSEPVTAEIEHAITHHSVETLQDILHIIRSSKDYRLNARTCKFILRSNPTEVSQFARLLDQKTHASMVYAMIADEYHTMPEHTAAFAAFITARQQGDNL